MESELADSKHELLKIREMLEMAEKVTDCATFFTYITDQKLLVYEMLKIFTIEAVVSKI